MHRDGRAYLNEGIDAMMHNYFFVDGAALLADIRRLWRDGVIPSSSKLNVKEFVRYFAVDNFESFHSGMYKRFTFYFVSRDGLENYLMLPDFRKPNSVEDIRIEICGKRLKEIDRAKKWLEEKSAPAYVTENLYRAEKAVDTQICCDALQLAAFGKLDRLFLYTNDSDFKPLCKSLRIMGNNINLFQLRSNDNDELICECDAFHTVEQDVLPTLFVAELPQPPVEPSATAPNGALPAK